MKKTEMVGASVTPVTKQKLQAIAKKKDWTLSHLINRILEEYSENAQSGGKPARQVTQQFAQTEKKQD